MSWLERAVQSVVDGGHADVVHSTPISGGCVSEVLRVELRGEFELTGFDEAPTTWVAKVSASASRSTLEEERAGLIALADADHVLVPRPIGLADAGSKSVLFTPYLERGSPTRATWQRFGSELDAMQRDGATRIGGGRGYGFDHDNHIGATRQRNDWCDDWVRFNAEHRLGYQIELAASASRIDRAERLQLERVVDRLGDWLPRCPERALLHGDLWSGNALPAIDRTGETRIAIIDPACSIGDGWADIAMMQLFGGFPAECFACYRAARPDVDHLEERLGVYRLYHVLNHLNLFGRSYAGQALSLARGLAS